MLDLEFVVVDGPHAKRKFWSNLVLAGTTSGHAQASDISRGMLRSILESARGIKPDDLSEQARARRTADLKDFDDIIFIAKIGVEKGKPKNDGSGENYADKNIIVGVITPDKQEWHPIDQLAPLQRWRQRCGRNSGIAGGTARVICSTRAGHCETPLGGRAVSAMRKTKPVAKLSFEDAWQRRATEAAIAAARGVVKPDGPIPPLTPIGTAGGHGMGVDCRRDPVRLDLDTRAAGDRRKPRRRANHPDNRARSGSMGRRCGRGDPARARRRLPRSRLVDAARGLVEGDDGRIPAHRAAADPPALIARDLSEKGITRKSSATA